MEIMGTREQGKKNYIAEPSPSGKAPDELTEKSSEPPSAQTAYQPADSNAVKPLDSNIYMKVKFEVYGEEMISKEVKQSGNSGRVYLPPDWIGKNLKIIRID